VLDTYLPAPDVMIRADFDRMRDYAAELRGLAREVADRSGIVHCEVLDHDLGGHLHQAEKDWKAYRSRLQSFLSETADTIDRIVARYEKTNDTVASAATCR
jgi:hypothetical protein